MSMLLALITVMALQTGGVATIVSDSNSNVEEFRHMVAWTPGDWATLWRTHAGMLKPAPSVDLTKRTVVAVFLGSRPTAGYSVEIVGTRQEGKTLVVEWREVRPKERMLLAQVLTSPAVIVSIPKFDGEIGFKKVEP
jgi:PrcB C-terminal